MKTKVAFSFALHCVFFLVLLSVSIVHVAAQAAGETSAVGVKQAISSILNEDGTIRTGSSGSFDPKGYRINYGPKGEPRFVPSSDNGALAAPASCADGWDDRFGVNGANGYVWAITSDGLGNVYFGGRFTVIGNISANGIAKWDGTNWSALGTGAFGNVMAITTIGTDVYAGGEFVQIGGVFTKVGKWNGTSWSGVGGTINGHVYALAASGTELYVGGAFTTAGGVTRNRIAKWNGTAWSNLGTGANNTVRAIAVSGSDVYVGGDFTTMSGTSMSRIAKWDGTAWSALGTGVSSGVYTIAVSGSDIYAGGFLTDAGGTPASYIAKWNGSAWSALGTGMNTLVRQIAISGSDVYAVGSFNTAGGTPVASIAKWNGTAWSAMGSGLNDTTFAVAVVGDTVYAGGMFTQAGGVVRTNIARWKSGTWSAMPASSGTTFGGIQSANIVAEINSMAQGPDGVYAGGDFAVAGNTAASRIAKWDGNSWKPLGSGMNNLVYAVAVSGNNIYAAGAFTTAGGVTVNRIAKWDGTSWSALGTGVNNVVNAIVVSGSDVYVGGDFTNAGGVPANRVAKWDGTSWSALSTGVNDSVKTMAISGTDLYVGGYLTTAGGISANRIAKWDGSSWSALGSGVTSFVYAIAVMGSDIYVGGSITTVGGTPANNIAKWNGTSWSAVGTGVNNNVWSLAVSGTDLYVGGDFSTAGGAAANRIAKWNGSSWSTFGSGMNDSVQALVVSGPDLYAGGAFNVSGCKPAVGFARLIGLRWTAASDNDWHNAANWSAGSVPAAGSNVAIDSNNSSITTADVTVNDLVVANGQTLTLGAGRTLTVTGNLNLSDGKIAGPGSVNVTNCDPLAVAGGSSSGFVSGPITRCVGETGEFNFPVGTGNVYAPVELYNVEGTGTFTVEPQSGGYSGAAEGLSTNRLQRWWQLTNNGLTSADVAFNYSDSEVVGVESLYRVYRIENGEAQLVSGTHDPVRNRFTVAGVTTFSPWTLAQSATTAGDVEISGRVVSAAGRGIRNVRVSMVDAYGNVRSAITSAFGYYKFDDVPVSRLYVLRAESKRYRFNQPQIVVVPADSLLNMDFVALEQ